jgi:hypothetical protein
MNWRIRPVSCGLSLQREPSDMPPQQWPFLPAESKRYILTMGNGGLI